VYEGHFGLNRRPFVESVDPATFLPMPGRLAVLRRLRYALEAGPALVFGPPGTGKTLLAQTLVRELGQPAVVLSYPALPAGELLALLAGELGAADRPSAGGPAAALQAVRRALAENVRAGRRTLIVVDEAHLIDDPATFEALRLLLNFHTAGLPDLSLLILGAPEVLLKLPPALADRLTARLLVGPLELPEAAAYVLGRLAAAGAPFPLFDDEALEALAIAADGLPRRLNRLADLALLIAYARGQDRADAPCVQAAAEEVGYDLLAAC
jgi:type II secretory pathway predicted ATPase ExeA